MVKSDYITPRYLTLIKRLPLNLQKEAKRLPYLLKITDKENGQWEEYTKLEIVYDLPSVIIRDQLLVNNTVVSADIVNKIQELNLCILLYFVCQDRMADNQVAPSVIIIELCCYFKKEIFKLVSEISNTDVECFFDKYEKSWQKGIAMEKKFIRAKVMSLHEYGLSIKYKNRYIVMASELLLILLPGFSKQKEHYISLCESFFTALQCRDDAVNYKRDQEELGYDFCTLLNCSQKELYGAAIIIMQKMKGVAEKENSLVISQSIGDCLTQGYQCFEDTENHDSHLQSILMALQICPMLSSIT